MSEAGAKSMRRRGLLLPAIFACLAFAMLISLGVWQVERLAWKNDLLARIQARTHARSIPLPPASEWPELAASDYEYTRVTVTGVYEANREALIYRGSGAVAGELTQPGYWVMTPLRVPEGAHILVNRGFIPLAMKDAPRVVPDGQTTITGVLRSPEARNVFTPADNPAKGEWFTRDPAAIGAALKLESPAPFSLDEDARVATQGLPAGGATVIDIPNNHLSYAVTWFGLAATLAGVFGFFAWKRRRE